MDLYFSIYDFVLFSLIDDYDDVFGDLEWFQVRIYVKKRGESKNSEGWKWQKTVGMAKLSDPKRIRFDPRQNYPIRIRYKKIRVRLR